MPASRLRRAHQRRAAPGGPVDFDAIDGAPVDLLFVLLVPEAATDEHLELLRQIASMLDRTEVRDRLRVAQSSDSLYQVVVDVQNGR